MRIEYSKGERASKELILLNRQSFEASSGRKMKVMLIFPPDWFPSEPYLSLPSLTAVLRQAGHTVIQKDINLEMWDWYFSEDFLKKVLRRVPQQLDRLRKASKKRELSEAEMELQLALCDVTRQKIDELITRAVKNIVAKYRAAGSGVDSLTLKQMEEDSKHELDDLLAQDLGGATLEIPDDRVDLVRLTIDRMAAQPEVATC